VLGDQASRASVRPVAIASFALASLTRAYRINTKSTSPPELLRRPTQAPVQLIAGPRNHIFFILSNESQVSAGRPNRIPPCPEY
jgi:hypothetical protein